MAGEDVVGGELPGRCAAEGSSSQGHTHLYPQLLHLTHTPTTPLPIKHGLASFGSLQVSESLSAGTCELISSSYWTEDQLALFCFCEATCLHRHAQEFCAGLRAVKDALLQKKEGYLF